MTQPLDALLAVTPTGPGRYALALPDGWRQGRGLFGGLVTGLLVQAFEHHRPGRALRSLTAELCGPVQPGDAALELETLRDGNAVSTVTARLLQDGQVLAHGVGVLGGPRTAERDGVFSTFPEGTGWRALEPLPVEPPLGPDFAAFWDFRADAHLPFSGEGPPRAQGWIFPKQPGTRRDAAFLAACIDAWWPATLALESAPRPMATVAFTFQPVGTFDGLDPSAALRYRGRVEAVRDGYAVELRELWGEDGRLLALNQQTICLIK